MHISHLQQRITSLKTLLDESSSCPVELSGSDDTDDVVSVTSRLKKNRIQPVEDHEHPLALLGASISPSTEKSDSVFGAPGSTGMVTSTFQLRREVESVCLDWRSLRNIKECVCSTPFDHFSKKVFYLFSLNLINSDYYFFIQSHCWRCGEVFCTRCLDKQTPLPGHSASVGFSNRAVPVCRTCYKEVRLSSSSITSP